MRLPRDISGVQLASALNTLGYTMTRQTGSHLRLTCNQPGEHHVTIPRHDPLRVGTLSTILSEVASFHGMSREDLLEMLKDELG
ncbi:MAG: type II toxin-antitoxin system HicA family toxin [Armatimonadota bacterium]